jgi:hypothetical protein
MPHLLKNKNLEVYIDFPKENYQKSRFDWTGKIAKVLLKGNLITSSEHLGNPIDDYCGEGFYNEFGIDTPVGFKEINIGDWFHKIGVGLLKKDSSVYDCQQNHEIDPCEFTVEIESNSVLIQCVSKMAHGYSYILEKKITLDENSFVINYVLKNTGDKLIQTTEYNHNFLAIEDGFIGEDYQLNFPFQIKPKLFIETVNLEEKVIVGESDITFSETPKEQFFFSNMSGGEEVNACWELIHKKLKIGIRETGGFQTAKINLWGAKHVICPETFFEISVAPGKSLKWSRTYDLFLLD